MLRATRWAAATAAAMGVGALALLLPGCLDSPDCGVCDKDNLVLTSISGPNYTGDLVHLVSPACKGDDCPGEFDSAKYFLDTIGPCIETDAAIEAADDFEDGAEEYCKIAPIVVTSGLQFIFNNLLEPETIEQIRKRPDNPNVYETYDWKTRVLSLEGPGTRYRGDWRHDTANDIERITRLVNLSCVETQDDYDPGAYEDPADDPCNSIATDRGFRPAKMAETMTFVAPRGRWDDRALGEASEIDCDDPQEGADTCCSQCDFVLTSQVAKYGLVASASAGDDVAIEDIASVLARPRFAGQAREAETAIACDPDDDRLLACAAFRPWTSRRNETLELFWPNDCAETSSEDDCNARTDECSWDSDTKACVGAAHGITWEDHLRELHPKFRGDAEAGNPACTSTAECRDPGQRALPGTECVGTNAADQECALDAGDPECTDGRCIAQWFVDCEADPGTTGGQGYCVDVRHDTAAAPGCTVAQECGKGGAGPCASAEVDDRISTCGDDDGRLTAAACCEGGEPCDPTYAANVEQLRSYERNEALPSRARDCRCSDSDEVGCTTSDDSDVESNDPEYNVITQTCATEPSGAVEDEHDYAINFVTRLGGVIYEPSLKGVQWRPADLGNTPRAAIEMCAEQRGLIDARNVQDGWRAHDAQGVTNESYEDFDRGMCSGQEYTVVFATGADDEVLRDKVGNTLAGKATYTFETPQFHVVPGSGFPSDALRIGACDEFTLQFSNKYDLSPENLTKLEIRDGDTIVAGGPGCAPTEAEVGPNRPPCLLVNVAEHHLGRIGVRIDPIVFGPVLAEGVGYELVVPGLASLDDVVPEDADDPDLVEAAASAYRAAFWDVCGMPLVKSVDDGEFVALYEFTVDPASCRDDADGDRIPRSCDNADDTPNPDQSDLDVDGFGDAADPCPTLATAGPETGDSDRDGIGNACDGCSLSADRYNENALAAGLPPYMFTRNVPTQTDADEDGIADVCDNCPTVANCGSYGPDTPHRLGAELPSEPSACQTDDDDSLVGDACEGLTAEGAAGPIGFGPYDDFDQDGVANVDDACPRQPLTEQVVCVDDSECEPGHACERVDSDDATGVCDHLDSEGDGVGDICDSCPYASNAEQVFDGGAQDDDPDGDFVGTKCELDAACSTEHGPRPVGFYEVAVAGQCCVTSLRVEGDSLVVVATGEALVDPDGLPVRLDCDDDGGSCRTLPAEVAALPGVLEPPTGCSEALAAAGIDDPSMTPRLASQDTDGDLDALWARACALPPSDLDFDGIGDACDLCIFGFDPENTPYQDEQGKLWPHDGAVCSGSYAGVCEGSDDPSESDDGVDASTDDGGSSSG